MAYHFSIVKPASSSSSKTFTLAELESLLSVTDGWQYEESTNTFSLEQGDIEGHLFFSNGELWTDKYSEIFISVLVTIFKPLGAEVIGDEQEIYGIDGLPKEKPNHSVKSKRDDELLRNLKREGQVTKLVIIGLFCLLGLVGFMIGRAFEK